MILGLWLFLKGVLFMLAGLCPPHVYVHNYQVYTLHLSDAVLDS